MTGVQTCALPISDAPLSFPRIFFPFFYLQSSPFFTQLATLLTHSIAVFCELNGISQTLSFASLAILNGASVPGRIIPNALADRFGVFNLLVPSSAVASVMIFAMLGATTPGGVIAVRSPLSKAISAGTDPGLVRSLPS